MKQHIASMPERDKPTKMTYCGSLRTLKKAFTISGLKFISIHSLRHLAVSYLTLQGESRRGIAAPAVEALNGTHEVLMEYLNAL